MGPNHAGCALGKHFYVRPWIPCLSETPDFSGVAESNYREVDEIEYLQRGLIVTLRMTVENGGLK